MASKRSKQPVQQPSRSLASTSRPNPANFVLIVTMLYILFAASFNHIVPLEAGPRAAFLIHSEQLATNPDEAAHVANAEEYKAGHIPILIKGNPDFEAHQPPLYYLLIAPMLNPGSDEPAVSARWISIICGALTIWVAYFAVLTITPNRPEYAQGVAAFVGLLPMNVSLNASISNDVLTNLVDVLAIWQMARIVSKLGDWTAKDSVIQSLVMGSILAAGIYTKTSTLVLFPMVIAAAIAGVFYKASTTRQGLIFAGVSCAVGLLLGLPWLIRNTLIYGDPLAQHVFLTAFSNTETTQKMLLLCHGPFQYLRLEIVSTFESFFGIFDSMRLRMPSWIYQLIVVGIVLCAVGVSRSVKLSKLSQPHRVIFIALTCLAVTTLIGYIRFNMTFFQAQGRYLFPALLPIGLFFSIGSTGLISTTNARSSPKLNIAVTALTIVLTLLDVYAIRLMSAIFPPVS